MMKLKNSEKELLMEKKVENNDNNSDLMDFNKTSL